MAAKNGLHVTPDLVAEWRQEIQKEENEIRERQQTVAALKRKAEAAEVLLEVAGSAAIAGSATAYANATILKAVVPAPKEAPEEIGEDDGDSVANRLLADMRNSGQSLKVKQVKGRLIDLGFGELLKAKPTYIYGLVYRLTKSGKLLKKGTKYRAPSNDSSKEETGAFGTPARH